MKRTDASRDRAPWLIIAMALAMLLFPHGADSADSKKTATALTGDRIELQGKQYCLADIDAPEPAQQCTLGERQTV